MTATRWTERARPGRDPAWLRQMLGEGKTYIEMAQLACCNKTTIYDALTRFGLIGRQGPGCEAEPVCDPDLCPGWERCLDDAEAPCGWGLAGPEDEPRDRGYGGAALMPMGILRWP